MHAKTPQGRLHFYYDGSRPSHVDFNGTLYTYVYSLQGDVLGLRDASGTLVVQYRYDAWGKQISKSGTLASTLGTANPFRYRGYIYDEETQLYYLQTRYYSPNRCRFISPDSLLGKAGGLLQHNLFCYCGNNPVALIDVSGSMAVPMLNALSNVYKLNMLTDETITIAVFAINGPNGIYLAFHEIAQLNAAKELYSNGFNTKLEHRLVSGKEVDIVSLESGYLWEVKPLMRSYHARIRTYTRETGYLPGINIGKVTGIPIIGDVKMALSGTDDGGIYYYFYIGDRSQSSTSVWTRIREVSVVASGIFLIVTGVTVIDDIFSGGAGIADDLASVTLATSIAAGLFGF